MKSAETTRRLDQDSTSVFDSSDILKSIDSIRNPTLDNADLLEIENEILEASTYFQKVLEDKDIENKGLGIPILFSIFLVMFLLEIFRMSNSYNLKSITSSLLKTDENGFEIKSLDDIDVFIRDKVFNTFLSNSSSHSYLALVGLKLTLKKSKIIKNPYKHFEYPKFVSDTYDYQGVNEEANERTSKFGIWNYDSDNQAYTEYFINTSLQDSLIKWREMKSVWLDSENFISLDIQMVTHCRNTFTTSYFSKIITVKSSGKFVCEDFSQGFSPEVYTYSGKRFTSIITIFTFLMILYAVQLLQFVKSYYMICARFIKKFEMKLNLYDYLEVIFIICQTMAISLFIKLDLSNPKEFSMPLSPVVFDNLIAHLSEYRHLIRISSMACLFSIMRLVALMKIQFPSFGVLFETIQLSKNDMLNICFISSILFCGFFISGHVAYGLQAEEFSNLSFAAMEYFRCMTGNVTFFYCKEFSCIVITIITMLFINIFYFVLTNLLYAVIISTFYTIKSKDRLLIAAKTEIVLERTKEFLKILIGFLKFDNRSMLYKEAKEYKKLSEVDTACMNNETREKVKNIENFIRGQMNIGFFQKIKFNLSALRMFLYETNLVNQEHFIENFKNKFRKILVQEKMEEKVHQLREFDVEYNFRLIRGLFCYILLILFFMLTVISFLSIKDSYEVSKINQDCATKYIIEGNSFESLKDIKTLQDVYNASELLVTSLLSHQCNWQEYLNSSIRLTIQIYHHENNPSSFSNSILPSYTSGTLDLSEFRGKNTRIDYLQYPKGNNNTYQFQGGISFTFNDVPYVKQTFTAIKLDELLNVFKLFAIEWVSVNPNVNTITYNSALFTIGIDEFITTEITAVTINQYFHSNDNKSAIFSISISFILCFYFFIANLIDLGELWRSVNEKRLSTKRKYYDMYFIIEQICGSQNKTFDSLAGSYYYSKIKGLIEGLFEYSFQLAKVLSIYFFTIPFNLLESVSIITTFVTLLNLFYVSIDYFEINNVTEAASVAEYIKYIRTLTAINSMILLIQLPAYLQIISKISYLMRMILSARLDFIFFMIMYFMILFSFVFSGYILLGHYNSGYSTVPLSLFSCYFMQFGQYDQEDYSKADNILGIPFIFMYVIVIMFFLTTMFTAIFSGNYQEDTHIYKMSTLEKIKNTISSRLQGKKVIHLLKHQEFDQENSISAIDQIGNPKEDEKIMKLDETVQKEIDKLSYFSALQKQLALNNFKFFISPSNTNYKIQYSEPSTLAFMNQHIWKELSIEERVKIWNSLSIQYCDQTIATEDLFYRELLNHVVGDFSDLQQRLWRSLNQQEKIEIWKSDLCNEGRAFIWKIEENSENFFEKWEMTSTKEKIEIAREFIKGEGSWQELWRSLPRYSTIKLNLLLSLKENPQNQIVMFLCILDTIESPTFIEMIDDKLEDILNNVIFNTKLRMCEYYAERKKFQKIKYMKLLALEECNSLIDYKNYLNAKIIGHYKNQRVQINNFMNS